MSKAPQKDEAKAEGGKVSPIKAILADKKKLMMIAPVALLLIGGGAAAALGVFSSKPTPVAEDAKKDGEAKDSHGAPAADAGGHAAPAADAGGHGGGGHGGGAKSTAKVASAYRAAFLDMPDMTVNLASNDGRNRYVKVAVTLEFGSAETAAVIEPILPRIQDTFQTYLRELRITDLDGSAGVYRLKEELTRRVNVATHPHKVTGILFREIILQ